MLAPVLAELAESWRTPRAASALIWLSASLGKRLRVVPALVSALARLAADLPFVQVAAAALGLPRSMRGPRFAALVPELLAMDTSFGGLSVVARYLSLSAAGSAGALLGDAPVTGTLRQRADALGGRLRRRVLPLDGAGRQAIHAAVLAAVATGEKRDVPSVRAAVEGLVKLLLRALPGR